MYEYVTGFERVAIAILIIMMALVVVLATVELGWTIIQDITTPPVVLLELDELLDIFGIFLLVLIGVELVETIKVFLTDRIIRVEDGVVCRYYSNHT